MKSRLPEKSSELSSVKSVRPVPKVTIDFGGGRKLERTLTGNSIHYVLDADGRPVEAIPGLYGPQAFLVQLAEGRTLVLATHDRALASGLCTRSITLVEGRIAGGPELEVLSG